MKRKKMIEYHLSDLTAKQAKAKGDIFFKAWKDYHKEKLKKMLKKIEKPVDKEIKV